MRYINSHYITLHYSITSCYFSDLSDSLVCVALHWHGSGRTGPAKRSVSCSAAVYVILRLHRLLTDEQGSVLGVQNCVYSGEARCILCFSLSICKCTCVFTVVVLTRRHLLQLHRCIADVGVTGCPQTDSNSTWTRLSCCGSD